jgi:outer membrane protein TolC
MATARTASAQGQPASPFLGGVPSGTATGETLSLSIADVISRALEHNLGVLKAGEQVERSRALRLQAQSDFLPNIDGRVAETRQQVNLKAFGFPLPAGFPALVGPFNVFDARLYLTQTLFDAQSLNDLRAERHTVAAAEYSQQRARDIVVLVAADMYLQALAGSARVDAALAQVTTANAMYTQAVDLKQSGLIPGIDVLRAQVQLNTERQRATAARNDFEKSRLQLARLIGLPVGQAFRLSDALPTVPTPDMPIEEALDRAYKTRPDYQAALSRVEAAEASRRATAGERLPTASINADFGDIGLSPSDSHSTFSVVGAVKIPIFGGDTAGKIAEADADVHSRRAEAEDLRASIYYDVRTAYLDLQATREQLQVATEGRDLAAQQLTQARDRFVAGIADNIEVVQAQDSVARANEQYIAALYGYNLAKGLLANGMGGAEATLRQLLGGTR